jgi:hypothetical protein
MEFAHNNERTACGVERHRVMGKMVSIELIRVLGVGLL